MKLEAVVLTDKAWAIGRDGDQIVRVKEDLKRFRELTADGILIYGRKTMATFPGGKALPERENWVLSRNPDFAPEGARVFRSLEELLDEVHSEKYKDQTFYVIGGEMVYNALLPYCRTVHVTEVGKVYEGSDCYFPRLDLDPSWEEVWRSEPFQAGKAKPFTYYFVRYERKN